ncbi:TPA: tonB-system energizer ExbB [Stenotrophomonas maltophilia]|nr:tonB-system energizer ExbB [Stenotrophomonas maltophilia]
MLMETETMLPADLVPVAAPALTPWGMYLAADVVVKAVMIALALASLATWTVLLAKGWELACQARQLRAARALLLQAPSLPGESADASVQQGTALAMLDAARTELRLSQDLEGRDGIKERIASRLDRIELETARVQRRGIGVLASIGAVAPFVGLFGTVWGIMNSFIGIAHSNTTNLAVVAPGIAEALLATALGLVAAIPAVLVYNHFSRVLAGLRGLLGDLAAAVQQLVSRDLDRTVPRTAAAPLRAVH